MESDMSTKRTTLELLNLYDVLMRRVTMRRTSEFNISEEEILKDDDIEDTERAGSDSSSEVSDMDLMAPEGGWGYVVCIGFSFMFIVVSAPISLLGVIYSDIFDDVDDGTSGITLVNGVYNAVASFTGFFVTFALKRFTLRQCGLMGALIFILGSILTIFTTKIPYLIFTIGILEGVGFGIMLPISMTTFNEYFVKRRAVFMGVTSIVIGVGFMLFPYLINFCKESYGLKGTLIILCGLGIHSLFSMAVMQPVEWHLTPKTVTQSVSVSDDNDTSITIDVNDNLSNNVVDNEDVETSLITFSETTKMHIKTTSSLLDISEKRLSLSCNNGYTNDTIDMLNLTKASSLANLGNWTGVSVANESLMIKKNVWKTFIDFFELSLLYNPIYSNMCFGVSFAFFSEITFFALVPVLLYHYNFTETEVAFCMTIAAGADLVSRVFLTALSFYYTISSRHVFYFGTTIILLLRNIFFQFTDLLSVTILIGLLGFFRSWILVPLPLVFAENCPKERFTVAYGLFMMVSGVLTLILSLIIGCLKTYSQNHMVAFHFLSICSLVLIVPWTLEFYLSHKRKRSITERVTG